MKHSSLISRLTSRIPSLKHMRILLPKDSCFLAVFSLPLEFSLLSLALRGGMRGRSQHCATVWLTAFFSFSFCLRACWSSHDVTERFHSTNPRSSWLRLPGNRQEWVRAVRRGGETSLAQWGCDFTPRRRISLSWEHAHKLCVQYMTTKQTTDGHAQNSKLFIVTERCQARVC